MNQEHINTGEYAFDPQADNLKDAMHKVENNFTQLFEVAENLNDQVSPPVILKVTHTLPCRPDKGGLYLIDRKEKSGYKAYVERYNLNFGRVNRKNRPVGDTIEFQNNYIEGVDYAFYENSLVNLALVNNGMNEIQFATSVINIEPNKPVDVIITSAVASYFVLFITWADELGEWYEEMYETTLDFIWNKSYKRLTLPTDVSSFRVVFRLLANAGTSSLNSLIFRQDLDIPEEKIKGDKRYVLTKWTGTEWIFPSVPDGAEIPIKGKTSYFKSGQIVTPAVNFPRLVKAKIGILDNPVTQQITEYIYLIFDRPLEVAEFSMIFSRYRGMHIRTPAAGNLGFQKGKTWRRYVNKNYSLDYSNNTPLYSNIRGFRVIGNNDFQKRFFANTPITDYRVVRIPLAEFQQAFFRQSMSEGNSYLRPLHSGLDNYIRKKLIHFYNWHFDFGFELVKTVNGKRVFGPFNKLRMRILSGERIHNVNLMK